MELQLTFFIALLLTLVFTGVLNCPKENGLTTKEILINYAIIIACIYASTYADKLK